MCFKLRASIAQLVEQGPLKAKVSGSSPDGGTLRQAQAEHFAGQTLGNVIQYNINNRACRKLAPFKKMLKKEAKTKIVKEHAIHEKDTGSCDVQIGLLTQEMEALVAHLKDHPKDLHSKRGLIRMVIKRKKLLAYLEQEDEKRYKEIVKKIGLKK